VFRWLRGVRARRRESFPREPRTNRAVGIGSLVYVVSVPGSRDEWEGEPSGVVIGKGDNEIAAYPGILVGRDASWLVAFDGLAYMKDGRGPFDQATIPGVHLVLVPPVDDNEPAYEA
jgi:hypothetical protein